jgi:hypothetical protein
MRTVFRVLFSIPIALFALLVAPASLIVLLLVELTRSAGRLSRAKRMPFITRHSEQFVTHGASNMRP